MSPASAGCGPVGPHARPPPGGGGRRGGARKGAAVGRTHPRAPRAFFAHRLQGKQVAPLSAGGQAQQGNAFQYNNIVFYILLFYS